MPRSSGGLMFGAGLVWAIALIGAQAAPKADHARPVKKLDYNRDVRPIITKCFTCHGPSSGAGQSGLRLDTFQLATRKLASGRRAIVPGKPRESELVERINAKDDSLMPPAETHKVLSADDKAIMANWIAQGAVYKEHWAFVPPVRPAVPHVRTAGWCKNPIDNFILAKLEEENLTPNQQADRRTLLRRVTLDLTGLPPTVAEADQFANDKSRNAYENVVNRLLASPRYGERMAMDWMDYSRYADSNGYQADYERFQSRWRDWVLEAFNKNMPYDEFTVEQIAGDLLPHATMKQRLATGFNRNHRINTEGGVIAEEWRIEGVIDRVETTSAVWLGLTTGCARCHDHKYDPTSQKDFYSLCAYFNNVPESGTGVEQPVNHPPLLSAPTAAQQRQLATLVDKLGPIKTEMSMLAFRHAKESKSWVIDSPVVVINKGLVGRYEFAPGVHPSYEAVGKPTFGLGRATGSVITSEESFVNLGAVGNFERDHSFSYGAWINPSKPDGSPFSRMDSGKDYRGWDAFLEGGSIAVHLISKWPENAIKIKAKPMVPTNAWTHVFVTYDGSSKASGLKIYLNGQQAETEVVQNTLSASIQTAVSTKIGRRTGSDNFMGQVDDFAIFDRALSAKEVSDMASPNPAGRLTSIPVVKRTHGQALEIARLFAYQKDAKYARLSNQFDALEKKRVDLVAAIPNVMVMAEMPVPRDCFILKRGQYDQHGEKVVAAVPSFLPPMPKGVPNNRLGLARWIVSPGNPLMARVTVNRLWERFFGQGLVTTVEDFGTRAAFPSHPELLDYLATEFVRQKWNMKAIIKELVMSATYRQSSNVTVAKMEADPTNKYLSHGPRFRLPAEVIRDQALYDSGLLSEKLGGPSVRPYQPKGIWDETNFYGNLRNYKHDVGPNLYRRSLYTIWKRTAAPPNMLLFDVPSREICRVLRARTDTPLQALVLLNDETYVEASRVLAQKMIHLGGPTLAGRIKLGFKSVLSRPPTAAELKILSVGLRKRLAHYRRDRSDALKLISVGVADRDMKLDPAELAAYSVTAGTLLNLDETLNHE